MATNIIITRTSAQLAETAAAAGHHAEWRLGVAAGMGVAFAILIWKPFFRDGSGFWECVKFWMKPDWISWWHGEGAEDWWAEFKLAAWVLLSGIFGFLTFVKLPAWFPSLFG